MRRGLSIAYSAVAWIVVALGLVQFVLAGMGIGRDIGMGFALVVIATVLVSLPGTRDDAPGLAAFHPLLALAVLGLASHIGSRYLPLGRGRGSTAAAA